MTINYTAWWFWINVAQMIFTAALGCYVWWTNRAKVTAARFATLEKQVAERVEKTALDAMDAERDNRCAQHRERTARAEMTIARMESDIKHLPSHHVIETLSTRISDLQGSLKEVSGRLSGINRAVDLMNEFLLNQGLKK